MSPINSIECAALLRTAAGGADAIGIHIDGRLIADVRIARTFAARCVGLLNRTSLAIDEGLLLVPGGSIHTFAMRFAIDVIFLDAHFVVLKVAPRVHPWRAIRAPSATRYVLELAMGRAEEANLGYGAQLSAHGVQTRSRIPVFAAPASAAPASTAPASTAPVLRNARRPRG